MTDGIINVLKPCGMTSHDVIGFLRRVLSTKKIGHSGTLDPDAAGVRLFLQVRQRAFWNTLRRTAKLPRRNYLRCKNRYRR